MTRQPREARGDGIGRWLLPASVLHAGLVLAAALSPWPRPAPERAAARQSAELESSVELTLLDDGEWSLSPGAVPSPAPPFDAPPASDEPRSPRVTVDSPRPLGARASTEPSPPPESNLELASNATPALPTSSEPPPSTAPSEPGSPSATLSLDQLGIGTNPFLDIRVEPLTKAEQASARLHAALHPPSLDRERQQNLGPAGPVAAAARSLVLSDETLTETSAVLNVRVDSTGRVTEVHVLDASSQTKAWQLIAARLAKALNTVTSSRAESKQGWDMKLRVASSVRLPSGAAPGMRMGVLGQQVAGSGGPGSTSLELSPTSKLDIKGPIDDVGRHMEPPITYEIALLKLRADPTDIGAPARRVVEVAVLSIDEPTAP